MPTVPKPTKIQYQWQERERLAFIHFGPNTWCGKEYDDMQFPPSQMEMSAFNPSQWCEAAISWGAKEIIFVAKHAGGFCWWPTKTTDYNVAATPYKNGKGDVVREVHDACIKHGLAFGLYISPCDLNFGAFNGGGGRTSDPSKQDAYNSIFRIQLEELLSSYPDTAEIWFDGGIVAPFQDIVNKYTPHAIVFQGKELSSIRWAGNEDGLIPYPSWASLDAQVLHTGIATAANSDKEGNAYAPIEVNTTLYNHNWFWSKENEKKRRSLEDLMYLYYTSVGRGGNFLLNINPDNTGAVPEGDVQRYAEFGNEIERRFGKGRELASTKGRGSVFLLDMENECEINHVLIMEEYQNGENVRRFTVEAKCGNEWKTIVHEGSMIGHKVIFPFPAIKTKTVRLNVIETAEEDAEIRFFAAYNVSGIDIENLCEKLNRPTGVFNGIHQANLHISDEAKSGKTVEQTVDISSCVLKAGQYTIEFNLPPNVEMEIKQIKLILEGQTTDTFIETMGTNKYRITRAAGVDSNVNMSTALQLQFSLAGKGVNMIYWGIEVQVHYMAKMI
ncbi:MAG: alpha-L-fucosidase [Spirochaetaceae bacterium]|jgi:alpha-L-fucosidase|nr:alpha-L-fucosidase [Spirochaetaceae bacterium]